MKSIFTAASLVFALLFSGSVLAEDWSTADTYRQSAVTALLVIDWTQTRHMAKHPCTNGGGRTDCASPFDERGLARPVIGTHPSVGTVNSYFVASIVGHAAVSYLLPPEWRPSWQYFEIVLQAVTVRRNHIGIEMGF